MSGLRREDITRIREKCDEEKLFYLEEKELDGWVMLAYQKRSGGE